MNRNMLKKSMLNVILLTTVAFPFNTINAFAIGVNTNGGILNTPYEVTPSKSENILNLKLVPNTTASTNQNVTITAYGTQSVSYIVRYAKVKIPIFELKEGSKESVGTAKITIPDLNITLIGSGTGSGSVSGTVSGNISGNATGVVNGDYSSYPWYGSGSGSVSGTVSGTVSGNVAGSINIPLSGSIKGTITSPGTVTGTSTTKIPTYELVTTQSKEYNIPYIIPIYTQIIGPDGTTVDGNICKYTATKNGVYNFTIKDTLGNSVVKSVTIDNIEKGDMDLKSFDISKTYVNGSVIRSVKETNVDDTGTVRAYAFKSDRSYVTYGYFLSVKQVNQIDTVALKNDSAGSLPVKEINIDVKPTDFYSSSVSSVDISKKFPGLASLSDGIYLDKNTSNGYRLVFIKETQPKIFNSSKIVNLALKNKAGTSINKTYKVEIEDKPTAYIAGKNNYILDSEGKNALLFTREDNPTLNLVTEVYDVVNYKSQVVVKEPSTKEILTQDPVINMSNSFKDTSIEEFTIPLSKVKSVIGDVQFYDISTIITNTEVKGSTNVIYNSNYANRLLVIRSPIDNMLDLSSMTRTISGTTTKLTMNPTLSIGTPIQNTLTDFNIEESEFKIALVDYSNIGGSNVLKLNSLTSLEDALKSNSAFKLYSNLSATFRTGSDIRLIFGIPGKFIDTIPLVSDIDVSLYNIDDAQSLVQNVSSDEPFSINIAADSGEYTYNIPKDLQKIKDDGILTKIILTNNGVSTNLLSVNKETALNLLDIKSEGIYNIKVEITNKYNATASDSKKLVLLHGETLKNSVRLKNDPTILITKDGLYDMHTKKMTNFTIDNSVDESRGRSLIGIRMSNNNILVVSTKTNQAELFTSSLKSIGVISMVDSALDITQYGEDILIAHGNFGVSSCNVNAIEGIINRVFQVEDTIPGPVYCLERLNSYVLVGGYNENALRIYVNNSKDYGFTLKESMRISDIFNKDDNVSTVHKMTIRNNKLELYPEGNSFYMIIELP